MKYNESIKMKIIKAPGAKTNTYLAVVDGAIINNKGMYSIRFDVRFTSDENGETLSFINGIQQIVVPFEPVSQLIDYTRGMRGKQ